MGYKHVDETTQGDEYVIGHKRLEMDGAKAFFSGMFGMFGAASLIGIAFALDRGPSPQIFATAGFIVGLLWAAFVFITVSTEYYSVRPNFGSKTMKFIYTWSFFFMLAYPVIEKANRIEAVVKLFILFLIIYFAIKFFLKATKKALKRNKSVTRN